MTTPASSTRARATFALAIGVSAFTLFLIEPLMGKRLLPILGGAASVWLVSLVFFQSALLVGYLGAFFLGRMTLRVQLYAQPVAILLVLAVTYPFPLAHGTDGATPELSTLRLLGMAIGGPFVVLAANASLLQSWLARVPVAPSSRVDAYGLYSASNLGSLLSLFVFPFLLEPFLGVAALMRIWSLSYLLTALLVALAAFATWKSVPRADMTAERIQPLRLPAARKWLPWCAYAFLPSALLSAVTNVLVSDIGSVPLLWTVPLGVYLFTYVLAFRERSPVDPVLRRFFPFASVLAAVVLVPTATSFSWWIAAVLFVFLFFGGYLAHRRLWDLRPPSEELSVFYLFVSLGGALGGTFVGILAPRLFTSTVEFPFLFFAMVLVGARASAPEGAKRTRWWLDVVLAATMGAAVFMVQRQQQRATLMLAVGVLALVTYAFRAAPMRFALCLLAMMAPTKLYRADASVVLRARNYYGTIEVTEDSGERRLSHGTTLHGLIELAHPEEPWTYYSRAGAVGASFQHAQSTHPAPLSYAFVGLGVGTMLTYVRADEPVTVFEIDPDMVNVASDERLFPFIAQAKRRTQVDIRTGDARLMLEKVPDHAYDFLALDAFSSDSIPVHLLTREAFLLYRAKLRERGVFIVHISNRYFALRGIVERLAREIGAPAFLGTQPDAGRQSAAEWVWVGVDPPPGFTPLPRTDALWTDDFSSPIRVLQ